MVQINFAKREVQAKIVYYGPAQSGKTTNLASVRTRTPDTIHGSLTTIATDTHRTLFFDFLPLNLGKVAGIHTKMNLYGVPWLENQNAVRMLVLEGVDGIVFVADRVSSRLKDNLEALENLADNLRTLGRNLEDIPMVFQWNKSDLRDVMPEVELNHQLNAAGHAESSAVAKTGEGVIKTLKMISQQVLENVSRGAVAKVPSMDSARRERLPAALEEEAPENEALPLREEVAVADESHGPSLFPSWHSREPESSTDTHRLLIQPVAAASTDVTDTGPLLPPRHNPLVPTEGTKVKTSTESRTRSRPIVLPAKPPRPRPEATAMGETATDVSNRLVKVRPPAALAGIPEVEKAYAGEWGGGENESARSPHEEGRHVGTRRVRPQRKQSVHTANLVAGAVFTVISLAAICYVVMKLL